jgi:hypothetical protein
MNALAAQPVWKQLQQRAWIHHAIIPHSRLLIIVMLPARSTSQPMGQTWSCLPGTYASEHADTVG